LALAIALSACGGADSPGPGAADAAGAEPEIDAAPSDAGPPPLSRLLYLADQDEDQIYELYLAGLTDELLGSSKVNAPTGGLSVRALGWSPAGDHLFYTVSELGRSWIELYVVPVDGVSAGAPVRVAVDLARSESDDVIGSIGPVRWSADGSRLAFLADETYQTRQLFVVTQDDWESPIPLTAGDVADFAWSPDGTSIAFRVATGDAEERGLFVVSRDGGQAARISGSEISQVPELSFWEEGYGWSPDSRRIYIRGRTLASSVMQLYVAETPFGDGDPPVRVSPAEVDELLGVVEARWSPDSSKLAFLDDPLFDPDRRLYVVDLADGLADPQVDAIPAIGADPFARWSPDSRWLAFTGLDGGPTEMFVVDTTASPLDPAKVNPPLPPDGQVAAGGRECVSTVWSPDSALLTYEARQEVDQLGGVWSSDLSGGSPAPPVRMSGEAGERSGVACPPRWSPDGGTVVYASDAERDNVVELFLVDRSSPGSPAKVNGELIFDGDVQDGYQQDLDFGWSPTGDWIAYRADQEVNERVELYAVRRTAPGQSVRVSSVVELGDVIDYAWAP
jgi:Tol biopolymer transport system component